MAKAEEAKPQTKAKRSEVTLYLEAAAPVHFPRAPMLSPGANIWPATTYQEVKRTAAFQAYLRKGKIRIDEDAPADTQGRDLETALDHVNQVFDVAELKGFLVTEKRPQVRQAILQQIEMIEAKPDDK